MTVQEIVDAALARGAEFQATFPNSFDVSRRRVQAHQQVLFSHAADVNRDYVGADAVLVLTTGACDTKLLTPKPMRIVRVFIEDAGTSGIATGRKVNIVPIDDLVSALAPRATLRDGIIAQVGTELAGVTSVRVWYSRQPAAIPLATNVPELPDQYHELLVIDLAMQMVRKTIGLSATSRDDILQVLQLEYQDMYGDFTEHLKNYNFAETARHGRTARQS